MMGADDSVNVALLGVEPKLSIASQAPLMQSSIATKMRGVNRPDSEFFVLFIKDQGSSANEAL